MRLLIFLLLTASAQAADLPRGFGHDDFTHDWVSSDCCGKNDCEPVPVEAVAQMPNGDFKVHFFSSQGFEVEGTVLAKNVKVSQDKKGRAVVCSTPPTIANPYSQTPTQTKGSVRCLYAIIGM